jgi:hypothetical protein
MTNLHLDWSTAKVSDGKLTVSLDEKPSEEWTASFERTAELLDRGTWAGVKLKKREVSVSQVEAGSEEKLRFFLESVVQEANAAQGSDEEDASAEEGREQASGEDEEAASEHDPDTEMTERFRGFAESGADS